MRESPKFASRASVQGELARRHLVLGDGVVEQGGEQRGAFSVGDAPADDAAAEDVEDDVEVEGGPCGGSLQLGDVPRPDLVGLHGQQLGLDVGGVAQLLAAGTDLAVGGQDAIHGPD